MMAPMETGQPHTPRSLGEYAKARRIELGLKIVPSTYETAGVSRGTWFNLEKGTTQPQPPSWAGIERVLRWRPGSIKAILAGEEPTPIPPAEPVDAVSKLREIADNPNRSEHLRTWARKQLVELAALTAAAAAEDQAISEQSG